MMETTNTFYSYSPITGEKLGPFKNMTRNEVNCIIKQARTSQKIWAQLSLTKRINFLIKMKKILALHAETYAEQIHRDNGKSLTEALTTEIIPILSILEYYIKKAKHILKPKKINLPFYLFGKKAFYICEPMGVIGVIGPWNYPLHLVLVPAISAIISGNAVIIKHSSQTPLTGVIIEDIIKKTGLPEGVISVIWGKGTAGQYLAEGDINKLFFTGSTEIGKKLAKICADSLIPVDLELGGSDPCIVLDSADLKRSAKGIVWGALLNSGQTCISIERVYVTEKNYPLLLTYLKEAISNITTGKEENADMGVMTTQSQIKIVTEQLEDAVKQGATIITGGKCENNIFQPTIITGCNNEMTIIREETFGPVIALVKTKNDEESLRLANDSPFGLSSSIYGKSKEALAYSKKLEAGSVVINNSILSIVVAELPYGGIKKSGIGKYHGEEGIKTFCNIKSILIDKAYFKEDFAWAPYGRDAFKKYLYFIKKTWGQGGILKYFSGLPLFFKKK
ncbi:MAG: aldehyde dehydrogenase family protein [Spirochaetales bacterium]|nr:aldehyde dehydrogenase family protein [Spirochaetales bacterium]